MECHRLSRFFGIVRRFSRLPDLWEALWRCRCVVGRQVRCWWWRCYQNAVGGRVVGGGNDVLRLHVTAQVDLTLEGARADDTGERLEAGVFPTVCDQV